MAKNKAAEPHVSKEKVFSSADEISQAIAKLRARIHQVEELKKDGLPYRDALKVTAEYQLRDTIREIFGEESPQFLEHQHLKIKVNAKNGINETISLLQHLIVSLEEKRLEVLGLRAVPRATALPATEAEPTAPPVPSTPPTPPAEPIPAPMPVPAVSAQAETARPPAPMDPTPPPVPPAATGPMRLKLSAEVPILVNDSTISVSPAPAAPPPASIAPHPQPSETGMSPHLVDAMSPVQSPQGEPPERSRLPNRTRPTQESETARPADTLALLRKICERFHRIARRLRQRRDERPTLDVEDERDVTDVLHALLSVEVDEIQVEEWSPPYAEGSSRADLCLKDDGIVVLAKKTRPGLSAKALTQQVSVDFERYKDHPDCKTLFCFIYDPEGRIGNPKVLEAELTLSFNDRHLEVLISPK
ncbi:PD-(D/E)XK nuclease domain-containing protein [Candidatus Nitrospira bockiana]